MPQYRLSVDDAGKTHLAPLDLAAGPFENGPGAFKGVGGAVLGNASRVMLMRFEPGAHPGFHRASPALAILLQGALVVHSSARDEVTLSPGDAIRVDPMPNGAWRLGNPGEADALLAVIPMPPAASHASGDLSD
ncbi:MAG: hypothetical protein O2924_04465 [Chloroflexi bacterium]|nr:hypothetical protein [Chloroflexota bacterium]